MSNTSTPEVEADPVDAAFSTVAAALDAAAEALPASQALELFERVAMHSSTMANGMVR